MDAREIATKYKILEYVVEIRRHLIQISVESFYQMKMLYLDLNELKKLI